MCTCSDQDHTQKFEMNHFTKKEQIHLFMYIKNGLNKFLAPFPGTEKFLSGNTRSLAYTDHIIQFGLTIYK